MWIAVAMLAALAQEPEPVFKFFSTVFGTNLMKAGGLTGLVYALEPGTQRLPAFDRLEPISKVWTTSLNIPLQPFDKGFPGVPERFEWFAIHYTGNLWIPKAGKYRFTLASDDGSALYIDDKLVIDNDGTHMLLLKKGSVHLEAGQHKIRVAYFQGPRLHLALTLRVGRPWQGMKVLNMDEFVPPKNLP